jgi:ribosomal protein L32
MRRSHDKIHIHIGNQCNNCENYKINHNMCKICGFYKGRLIKTPKIKKNNIIKN